MTGRLDRAPLLLAAMLLVLLAACDSGVPTAEDSVAEPDAAARSASPVSMDSPTAEVASAAGRTVVSERLPYAEVDDQLVYGHFVFPEDMVDPLPGIIVIHERWGLDDRTRALADRIAGQGYVVLAIDLFEGKTATNAAEARTLMVRLVENPDPAYENLRQAHQFLVDSGLAPSIGVLGWSLGGTWALNAALLFPDSLQAAVIYYGQVTDDEERLAPLTVPLLGLFGANDRGVTRDNVAAFESTLQNLGKEFEIEVFPDAGHAFADPKAPTYNPAAAEAAWQHTLAFLDRYLSAGAD